MVSFTLELNFIGAIMSTEELELYRKIGSLESAIQTLTQGIEHMRADIGTRMDKVGNLLDMGGARMTDIESKLMLYGKDCENCRSGMNREITSIKDRVDKLENRPEKTRQSYTSWIQTILVTAALLSAFGGWKLIEAFLKK
jgi:hypothetical protein